jgi:hypothetical protein
MSSRPDKETIDVLRRFASSIIDSAEETLKIPDNRFNEMSRAYATANKHMAATILSIIGMEKIAAKEGE